MMAVLFIAYEKDFKFHAQPQTVAYSCLHLLIMTSRLFSSYQDFEEFRNFPRKATEFLYIFSRSPDLWTWSGVMLYIILS